MLVKSTRIFGVIALRVALRPPPPGGQIGLEISRPHRPHRSLRWLTPIGEDDPLPEPSAVTVYSSALVEPRSPSQTCALGTARTMRSGVAYSPASLPATTPITACPPSETCTCST